MIQKRASLGGVWLALSGFVASLGAADFHPISSVSTNTTDLYAVGNLIQGWGVGYQAAEPHQRLGGGSSHTWVTNAPNGGSGDYFANGQADPVLIFDLGANRSLSEISTWGYANSNTNGAKDFTLRFATSAEGTSGFGTSISYSPSFDAGFNADNRDSHSFSQTVFARYVEMRITDNWRNMQGGTPGGDRVGLGEVAFEDAVPPPDPLLSAEDSYSLELDGSVQTILIPLENLGATQNLTISSPGFTGANAAAFSITSSPTSIAPGATENFNLSFNPSGLSGAIAATLNFTTNDTTQSSVSIDLTGFVHDPKLVVANFVNLGAFPSGSGVQSGSFSISNEGGGNTLSISSITVGGSNAVNFSVTSSPSSIAPLASNTITVQFDPQGNDGLFSASLEISSNDAMNPVRVVNVSAQVGDAIPNSGLRINEFMASNGTTLNDGDGNSSDWIEIYNAGPGPVDLGGWYLTDEAGDLNKWEFPAGTTLAEDEYLVVFASGQNVDDYVDGVGNLHTNFKLTTNGEYLALVMPDGTTVKSEFTPSFPAQFNDVSYGTYSSGGSSTDLIASSDAEIFIPKDGALGLTWTGTAFTPGAGWLIGGTGSGVGYDTNPDYNSYIDVDIESELQGNGTSAYIRLPFQVADASAIDDLELTMRYDDGFYVYLNGTEIASRNAPVNPAWDSVADGSVDEANNVEVIDVSAFLSSLQNGANVLAIHGMNRTSGSSDFLMDPILTGTSTSGGALQVGYLSSPTPGAANTTGSANPGPRISNVGHTPAQPAETENIVVTALVEPRQVSVGQVELNYRVQYGTTATLTMVDDGTGDDAIAGDMVYTATIPSSAYGVEDMVRWYVAADDVAANTSRDPAFLDQSGKNQSAEYFGTVTKDPSVTSGMPIFQWFTQNVSASHNRSGTRASVYFLGRFYDNIYVRQRGGATNGSVSQKFDFNKGDPFYASAEMPSVGEINMNGNGADSTYVRQILGFDTHRFAGNEGCLSYLWQMRVNGGNDRVGVAIEQVDEDFLKRNGYDPDGDLYKFVQRSNLDPVFADTITGIEKKTGDETNIDSAVDLVAGLNLATSAQRRAWVVDNLDLPQVINYLAARSIIQDADDLRKNFYMFQDARGDCRWRMLPWDKDFTFGVVGDGGTHLPHPFFGDEEHKKQNANQWNILYDVIFEEPVTQRMYLRRLRTLMDEVLEPTSVPFANRILESRAAEIISPASPPLSSNLSSINSYLNSRRSVLESYSTSLIPTSQPSMPNLAFDSVDANPSGGNQDEEYIRITNSENTEIDISGWTIEGGVTFTFKAGTVIERNSELYVSPDTKAFLNRASAPNAGGENVVTGPYSGHLSNFSETLILRNADGVIVDSFMTPNQPSDAQLYLVVSEIMYHPADPNGDAEYIELMNISDAVTLDLSGVSFTAGVDFTFSNGTMLAPGETIVVVLNQVAFESVHGTGLNVAGEFENGSRLNNGSDAMKLEDANNSSIHEFTYDDESPWPTGPDGGGFSLVLVNPGSFPDHDDAGSWRESTTVGGNPGGSDAEVFTGNPTDDLDGDGLNALVEHALGSSDNVSDPSPLCLDLTSTNAQLSFKVNQAAEDVAVTLQQSPDLNTWTTPDDLVFVSRVNNGDGTATLTYESLAGFLSTETRHFFRLKIELLP